MSGVDGEVEGQTKALCLWLGQDMVYMVTGIGLLDRKSQDTDA